MPSLRSLGLTLGLCSIPLAPACVEDSGGTGGLAGEELPAPDDEADPDDVPSDSEALLAWLAAEPYLDWPAESAIHGSTGPHFGNVRTWVNPLLLESLEQGAAQHPAGSAAVKELYGSGDERLGWAVSVKLAEDSEDGEQWYWYEWYNGGLIAQGDGISLCTGCHRGGSDFVLTPFPLQ